MLAKLLGVLLGGTATNIAGAVFGKLGLVAVLTPALVWFIAHKDEPFITVSYGVAGFILAMLWLLGWVLTRVNPPASTWTRS